MVKHFGMSYNIRSTDDIGRQLLITMGNTQLELGVSTQFFQLDFQHYSHLLTPTWLTHLWEFLSLANITLQHSPLVSVWSPMLQRGNDSFIMDQVNLAPFSTSAKRIIHEWRIYLRAITIADLATYQGNKITRDVFYGWRSTERSSNLKWPVSSRPHQDLLHYWQAFLITLVNERKLLYTSLTEWLPPCHCHKTWNYKTDPMGGLWRFDRIVGSFVELQRAATRTLPDRSRFFRMRFATPLQLATPVEVANWVSTDIIDKGHLSKTAHHITTLHCIRRPPSATIHVPEPEPSDSAVQSPFIKFRHCLGRLSVTQIRQAGLSELRNVSAEALECIVGKSGSGNLYCVSDGSFSPTSGKGSQAWILTDEKQEHHIQGAGPVDRDPSTMSAYRPEFQGILANITFLTLLAAAYPLPLNAAVTIVCDNEAATIEPNKIVKDPNHLVDPLQTDYNLLMEIQGELQALPINISVQWIRGHQEDNAAVDTLDFLALLNIDCDTRAKAFLREAAGSSAPPPLILRHKKWGAIWGHNKITTDLKTTIFDHYTLGTTKRYLCKKFSWTHSDIDKIAWTSILHAKSKLQMPRNAFVCKLMFDKLPIAERLHFVDSSESPTCLTCNQSIENQSHLFKCCESACRKHQI